MEPFLIVTLRSSFEVLQVQELLSAHLLPSEMVNRPSGVEKSCGLALATPLENLTKIREILQESGDFHPHYYHFDSQLGPRRIGENK